MGLTIVLVQAIVAPSSLVLAHHPQELGGVWWLEPLECGRSLAALHLLLLLKLLLGIFPRESFRHVGCFFVGFVGVVVVGVDTFFFSWFGSQVELLT